MNGKTALGKLIKVFLGKQIRWTFRSPGQSDILIADTEGRSRLERIFSLQGKTEVLRFRVGEPEFILYLSPLILATCLSKAIRNFIKSRFKIRAFFDPVVYFESCVRVINPKIILDNTHVPFLARIASAYPQIQFLIILNGYAYQSTPESPALYSETYQDALFRNWDKSAFPLNNFHVFCLGQKDISLFIKSGLDPDRLGIKYYAIGSVCTDYYIKHSGRQKVHNQYDICFVSQITSDSLEVRQPGDCNLKCQTDLAVRVLAEYVRFHKLKLLVQLRSHKSDEYLEREYFRESLAGCEDVSFSSRAHDFSSYEAIFSSRTVISIHSTLGFEALAMGKRVLFHLLDFHKWLKISCDKYQSDHEMWPWVILCPDKDNYFARLDELRAMSEEDYSQFLQEAGSYFVHANHTGSAHSFVQKKIEEILSVGTKI